MPLVKARVRSDGRVVSWGMGDDWLLVLGLFGSVLCEGVSLFSGACNTDSPRTLSTVSASVKTQLWQRSSTGLHIVQKGLLTIALISLVARCGVSVTQFRCSMQRSQHGRQRKCLHGRLTSSGTPVSVQRGGRASQSMQVVLGHSAVCMFACVGRLGGAELISRRVCPPPPDLRAWGPGPKKQKHLSVTAVTSRLPSITYTATLLTRGKSAPGASRTGCGVCRREVTHRRIGTFPGGSDIQRS